MRKRRLRAEIKFIMTSFVMMIVIGSLMTRPNFTETSYTIKAEDILQAEVKEKYSETEYGVRKYYVVLSVNEIKYIKEVTRDYYIRTSVYEEVDAIFKEDSIVVLDYKN